MDDGMTERGSSLSTLAWRAASALAAAGALAACGVGAAAPAPAPRTAVAASAVADGDLQLQALSPRELGRGECGLFLWTRTPDPQFIFFADPSAGRAAIALDGREVALRRLAVDASGAAGRPGAQAFATDSGDVSLRLTVQDTEAVENGYRVKSASLRVTRVDGWSGMVATAGLAACQP
jgi:hypothetical protein